MILRNNFVNKIKQKYSILEMFISTSIFLGLIKRISMLIRPIYVMRLFFMILFVSSSLFSQSIEVLAKRVDSVNDLIFSKNYELALKKTNEILDEGYKMSELYLLKAICLMEGNKNFISNDSLYKKTFECLNIAIDLDYMNHRAYGRRGLLNLTNKHFNEAIDDYTKFLSLTKDSLEIFNGLTDRGVAKIYSGDLKGAIEDYEKAITYNPNDVSIYINLGAIYIDGENYNKADELLQKGYEIFPNNPGVLNNLGFLNIKLKDYKAAKKYFNKSIKINDSDFLAYGNRGFCYLKLGKLDKARFDLDKSIKLNPDNSYVYMYNALYYIKIKNKKQTCENLVKANNLGFSKMYGNKVNELIVKHCN